MQTSASISRRAASGTPSLGLRSAALVLLSLTLLVAVMGSGLPAEAAGRKLRFGAYVPEAPIEGMEEFSRLEQEIDNRLGIVHFYQAWGGAGAPFRRDWLEAAAAGNRTVLLTWEPWVPNGSAHQPEYALRKIVRGKHDDYVRTWARGLKRYGKRVFLRPMHEMNGTWYPWGGTVNGNSPTAYRKAWRRIHRIFSRVGAHNVRWVWSPLADDVPSDNRFERYYPGNAYVDVLALDGYNWGTSEPGYGGWRSFRQIFAKPYRRLARLARKPVWIAEVGSAAEGGDKRVWTRSMFRRLNRGFAPRVRAVVWFHTNKERDWRVTNPSRVALIVARWLRSFA